MDGRAKDWTSEQQREDRTLRTLQNLVDCAGRRLVAGNVSRTEAETIAAEVRQAALRIIPDQMDRFDLIYGARLRRWIEQFCP